MESRGIRPLSRLLSSHSSCQLPNLACGSCPRCDVSPPVCLNRRVPRGPRAACDCVSVKILITTHSCDTGASVRTHRQTHARSIGVQSGKGLSVVLCEWPLLKQINRHWHVPPPTERKQLKAIDPVPGSSMNMHVSLTFPWRRCCVGGAGGESDRQMQRRALFSLSTLALL